MSLAVHRTYEYILMYVEQFYTQCVSEIDEAAVCWCNKVTDFW